MSMVSSRNIILISSPFVIVFIVGCMEVPTDFNGPPDSPILSVVPGEHSYAVPCVLLVTGADPEGGPLSYQFGVQSALGDSVLASWSCYYPSGEEVTFILQAYEGTYSVSVRSRDNVGNLSVFSDTAVVAFRDSPPYAPERPWGRPSVLARVNADYQTCAWEPEGDEVSFRFDPGDGSEYSSWSPPQPYSYEQECYHYSYGYAYPDPGTFLMRVQARDVKGNISLWSEALEVECMPNIELIGICEAPGGSTAVALGEGYAYVCGSESGLQIVDISDPLAPEAIGSAGGFTASDIDYVEDRVVMLGQSGYWAGDLLVYDVSSPTAPVETGRAGLHDPQCVDAQGNLVVVGTGWFEQYMYAFDISSVDTLIELGSVEIGEITDVEMVQPHVYVMVDEFLYSVMVVVSVATPRSPRVVSNTVIPGSGFGPRLLTAGPSPYMYVVTCDTLSCVDIGNSSPKMVSKAQVRGSVTDIHCSGNRLALTYGDGGIDLFDVSVPAVQHLIGRLDAVGSCDAVRCADEMMYVVDRSGRLLVFSYPPLDHRVDVIATPVPTRAEPLLRWGGVSIIPMGSGQ